MTIKKICIVGAGTAGAIAATYIKKFWGNRAEVTLIYDHSSPGIGVGESLTPMMYSYLDFVGITREDLIKNVNATVKLGLKFKNWLNDNEYFYHGFNELADGSNDFNYSLAFDIVTGREYNDTMYSKHYYEDCTIPADPKAVQSLHIDANLFSQYVLGRFKDEITILDNVVSDVVLQPNSNTIDYLVLKDNEKFSADFFIDASGFASVLFKHLRTDWVDKKDCLPIDRCIPNMVHTTFDKQPPYTTAEATDQGWILQVPLSNRWGTGYLYCSRFLSDEQAFKNFDTFLQDRYGVPLKNKERVLKFNSGYWSKQWVGNCLSIGLSSGFAEPLEATNLHLTIIQIIHFTNMYNEEVKEHDIFQYNKVIQSLYDNVYLYLGFCYTTGRTDSEFWRYVTANVPESVLNLKDKIKDDVLNFSAVSSPRMFHTDNFTKIAWGMKKINVDSYKQLLDRRDVVAQARAISNNHKKIKEINRYDTIDHRQYIEKILKEHK
jgi:tryptophan halogenase